MNLDIVLLTFGVALCIHYETAKSFIRRSMKLLKHIGCMILVDISLFIQYPMPEYSAINVYGVVFYYFLKYLFYELLYLGLHL